ncbi:hypothetical protein R5H30_19835 [Sulfitobacter sp. D35]|uniref:hypothetical protein n=1 Tax=Sulfitobacter sp. D35 TaxID=3083252 RepID=UPI00296FC9C0|nr:hypothetical protein [Sulfitobacter sp. D35]MDW4500248.1 hypothetical protein [Sulfitobacter sp. D35]
MTAPIVADLLETRRTFGVWTFGFTWQFTGLSDLYVAVELQLISPVGTAPYFVIPVGIVLHSTSADLIARNRQAFFMQAG